jgi:hypothetical protein
VTQVGARLPGDALGEWSRRRRGRRHRPGLGIELDREAAEAHLRPEDEDFLA